MLDNKTAVSILLGFILDLLIGDPESFPYHPIRLIGYLIGWLESFLNKQTDTIGNALRGMLLVFSVLFATGVTVYGVCVFFSFLHPVAGILVEAVWIYFALAVRSLRDESSKVAKALKNKNIPLARKMLSRIVGRDTNALDEQGILRATVETVAENISDGVIAPLFYSFLFGPVGAYMYKAINTMDSMIGYKNERYRTFGSAAAKADDIVNLLPSRLSAFLLLTVSIGLGKEFDTKRGLKIFFRDRGKSASPNAGQTESVVAGLLGIELLGDAVYFGKTVHKEWIGDAVRPAQIQDIVRVQKLLYASALCMVVWGMIQLICTSIWL